VLESIIALPFTLALDLENVEFLPLIEVVAGILDVLLDKAVLSTVLQHTNVCLQAVVYVVNGVYFGLLVQSA